MIRLLPLISILLLISYNASASQQQKIDRANVTTLQFVHLLWRHGARSPAHGTFPTDVNNTESTWPQGWGELSSKGIRQHYELGRSLRYRYDGFISTNYSQFEITVRSTDYNRTIMSAMANMAGLFPPKGGQIWDENLRWQPIPIHSVPYQMDNILNPGYPCPRIDSLWENRVKNLPAIKALADKYDSFLTLLKNYSGAKFPEGVFSIGDVYDPLHCEMEHRDQGRTMPFWVTDELYQNITRLASQIEQFDFYDPDILRVRGGMLLKDMLDRMVAKQRRDIDNRQRVYFYSAHDTTLIAFMQLLSIFNGLYPPYASAIMVELHRRPIDGIHFIQIYYWNISDIAGESGGLFQLHLPFCPDPCTLEKFTNVSRTLIPVDFVAECNGTTWSMVSLSTYSVLITILATILLFITIVLAVWAMTMWRQHRQLQYRYTQVATTMNDSDSDLSDNDNNLS